MELCAIYKAQWVGVELHPTTFIYLLSCNNSYDYLKKEPQITF